MKLQALHIPYPFSIVLLACVLLAQTSLATSKQDILATRVSLSLKNITLEEALLKIEDAAQVKFAYSPSRVKVSAVVSIQVTEATLDNVLKELLTPRGITYAVEDRNLISLTTPAKEQPKQDQSKASVSGTVTDALTNQAIPGVNVVVKGTTNGTSTNANGSYTLLADDKATLVFSFIGYKTIETTLSARSLIDIKLEQDVAALKEVVINAGYYDVTDKEKTGSIAKVTSDIIEKQPINNPVAALAGRMPGVFVQQTNGLPGSEVRIEIRGRNSLRSLQNAGQVVDGNEPLYIVDGVPFSTQRVSNSAHTLEFSPSSAGGLSPLTSINPADIESIEVLKDADATAIYGSRGANGVVLITTKKGKAGKTKVEFSSYTGVGKAPMLKRLNTQQYLALRKEAYVNSGIEPSATPGNPGYAPDLMIWDTTRYTDWAKVAQGGTAQLTNIQGSISGGNELTQFLFTVGYRKEGTVLIGDPAYQKGSGHLSVNHKSVNRKFLMNVSVSGTMDANDQNSVHPGRMTLLPPNAPALYDESGALNWEGFTWDNPLARLDGKYEGRTRNLISNAIIGYELIKGLTIKSSFGLNFLNTKELTLRPSTMYSPAQGRTSESSVTVAGSGSTMSWIIEPQVNYERKIAKGKLAVLAGATLQEQQHERLSMRYTGFSSNAMMRNYSSAAQIIPSIYNAPYSLYRYAAIFSRLNYNWKGKYILNLTGRRDGSSRFGPGRQFANFGAIGAAWIFTEEGFVKNNVSILSFGKLRGSYGITGSDQIGDYQYMDTYSSNLLDNNSYQNIAGLTLTKLYNPDFAWETNQKLEGAIELGFLHDRILLNVSYYRNRSSNQLVDYTLPLTTGFTGILANFPATIQNTGTEIELTTKNIQTENLKWTTSFNVSMPRNKLLEFPNLEASTYARTYVVGQPVFIRMFYESTGVDPQTGLYTFRDRNGDEVINVADRTKPVFVGYDFFGGLNNSLSFKQWTLDIFFQFTKQDGYNYKEVQQISDMQNQSVYVLEEKRWQQPGDIATVQRSFLRSNSDTRARNAELQYTQSDAITSDASFIRLRNISLAYRLPQAWTKVVTGTVYLQGQNLFVITGYKGVDPESQSNPVLGLGPLRMVTAGIQVAF